MFLLLPFSPISCFSVSSSSFLLPGGTFSEGSPGLVAAPERTTNPRQETMVDEHSGYTAMDTRHGLDVEWLGQVAGTGGWRLSPIDLCLGKGHPASETR